MTVDLKAEGKNKAGDLTLVLDGLDINMRQYPRRPKNGNGNGLYKFFYV